MSTSHTTETTTALASVAFIDEWLSENAMWVDSRVMDFALDLRMLLSSTTAELDEREPVGADA
jgi:hypothetical protein